MVEMKQSNDLVDDNREIRRTFHKEFARALGAAAAAQLVNQEGQSPRADGKGGGVQIGPAVQAGPAVQVGPIVQVGPLVQTGGAPVPIEQIQEARIVLACGAAASSTTFEVTVEETESFAFTPGSRREKEACMRLKSAAETRASQEVVRVAQNHAARHKCEGDCPDGQPCNSTPQVSITDPDTISMCLPIEEGYVWDTLTARATAKCTVTVECRCRRLV